MTVPVPRKKQAIFRSAVAYAVLLAALAVVYVLMAADPFTLSQLIIVRLLPILILLLVMPTSPTSTLALIASFTFLVIIDLLGVFWSGNYDLAITAISALVGLVFAIRSYEKMQEKAKRHILWWLGITGGMFAWLFFVGYAIGTFYALIRGSGEEQAQAIGDLVSVVVMMIVGGGAGIWGARKRKREKK